MHFVTPEDCYKGLDYECERTTGLLNPHTYVRRVYSPKSQFSILTALRWDGHIDISDFVFSCMQYDIVLCGGIAELRDCTKVTYDMSFRELPRDLHQRLEIRYSREKYFGQYSDYECNRSVPDFKLIYKFEVSDYEMRCDDCFLVLVKVPFLQDYYFEASVIFPQTVKNELESQLSNAKNEGVIIESRHFSEEIGFNKIVEELEG